MFLSSNANWINVFVLLKATCIMWVQCKLTILPVFLKQIHTNTHTHTWAHIQTETCNHAEVSTPI